MTLFRGRGNKKCVEIFSLYTCKGRDKLEEFDGTFKNISEPGQPWEETGLGEKFPPPTLLSQARELWLIFFTLNRKYLMSVVE
jgi:hypothetical protein